MKITKSSGGVVVNPEGKILIVSQKGTSWSLPKGHINEGEGELTAARREIYEESGITDLELIRKLGSYERYSLNSHGQESKVELKNIAFFLFKTKTEVLKPVDPDNPEAKWVEKEEVANYLTHKKDKDFFESIISEIDKIILGNQVSK